jgi:hypothetical protein
LQDATLGTTRLSFNVTPLQLNAPPNPPSVNETLALAGAGVAPVFFVSGATPTIEQPIIAPSSFGQDTAVSVSSSGTGLGVPNLPQ